MSAPSEEPGTCGHHGGLETISSPIHTTKQTQGQHRGDHFTVQKISISSQPLGIIPPFDLLKQDMDCRLEHNSFLLKEKPAQSK